MRFRLHNIIGIIRLALPLTFAAILLAGCASPPSRPATPCPPLGCTAEPYPALQPRSAIQSEADPVRDAMTEEMRRQLTDRMTDFVYAAAGDMAVDSPDTTPHHLVDRPYHDSCLVQIREALYDYINPAQLDRPPPDDFYKEQAAALQQCLAAGISDWEQATPGERSRWLRHILQAAARTTDPAEHHRPLLHNEHTDPGWVKLQQDFRECQERAIPLADHIAIAGDIAAVSAQVRQGIADIADCNSGLTQIRYPEPTDALEPSPTGAGNASPALSPPPFAASVWPSPSSEWQTRCFRNRPNRSPRRVRRLTIWPPYRLPFLPRSRTKLRPPLRRTSTKRTSGV